ncbi:spermatogenesis-associated protein 1 [Chanos chanos]|uniref:Spermatogenesis-associated protein 1 n=1 Tax=Chanos chanos TaxID=29144 RepID=A0A6J2W7M4_CHACN|nr:spermatogenesis-associated protein 1 [Chanos chanos]
MSNFVEKSAISECVELHVLYVPEEQWNARLNKVSVEAIDGFISAGFIRVFPDLNLKTLREELGALLGADKAIGKFCFLKCVGRSLALVKAKQERDLRVKSFAPPYAPHPELYLLPLLENASSVCSRSFSPDTLSYNADPQTYYPTKTPQASRLTKESTKFPLIKQVPESPPLAPSVDDEESSGSPEVKEEDCVSSEYSPWGEVHHLSSTVQEQACALATKPAGAPTRKKYHFKRNCTRDSGIPESLEDETPSQNRKFKNQKRPPNEVHENRSSLSSVPVKCNSPSADSSPDLPARKPATTVFSTNRNELIAQIRLVKEERKQLEKTRQDLLRKGKELIALNRHRRNQARDSWKRRYFDTKKATAPLEETLKALRQELETSYNKLLQQLQARDGRSKHKRLGISRTKNELIIQILTENCEIENLRKNVEDAKMKLATEIKLRKQAATELGALKAELLQKKTSLSGSIIVDSGSGFGRS